jgi:hypothetical protein
MKFTDKSKNESTRTVHEKIHQKIGSFCSSGVFFVLFVPNVTQNTFCINYNKTPF